MKKLLVVIIAVVLTGSASAQEKVQIRTDTAKHKSGTMVYLNRNRQKELLTLTLVEGDNIFCFPGGPKVKLKKSNNGQCTVGLIDDDGKSVDLKPVQNISIDGGQPTFFKSADNKITVEIQKAGTAGHYKAYLKREAN